MNEERAKSMEGRLDYISGAIKKLEVAKKRITEAFKAEVMTLPELRKEKTDIELSEEKLISERDALMMKLNVQHDVSAKIDLFKETCHKFLSKINDPKTVTERLKKDIIKLVIDEVVIEGESVKIFATISLPNKIHEREMDKTDIPGTFNAGAALGPVNETNMARIRNKHKQSNAPLKRKVFVAMSGGVDSSMAALLLKKQGFAVTGVYFNLFNRPDADWQMVKRAGRKIGIPTKKINFQTDFQRQIINYFCRSYQRGQTPNPCIFCNPQIKFGLFWRWAKKQRADFLATGHYARLQREFPISNFQFPNKKGKNKLYLLKGKDKTKDQSYFLYRLRQKDLARILFPLGDLTKIKVRALAKKNGLPNAQKVSSQNVCFMQKTDLKTFLGQKIKTAAKPGQIREKETKKFLGQHQGLIFYTRGQRGGLGLGGGPWYVVDKDRRQNVLEVTKNKKLLLDRELICRQLNWILDSPPKLPLKVLAQIRYRAKPTRAQIKKAKDNQLRVIFDQPQYAPAAGQSVVFYDEEKVLGGGVILK